MNIVDNAIKFTDRGSVELNAVTKGKDVAIRIKDTGIGIKQKDIETVFEPFVQLDGGTTRKHGGTGLGLAICKELVELLGGRIWLESDGVGEGTTVSITIPI